MTSLLIHYRIFTIVHFSKIQHYSLFTLHSSLILSPLSRIIIALIVSSAAFFLKSHLSQIFLAASEIISPDCTLE